jgi:hypothetical protein
LVRRDAKEVVLSSESVARGAQEREAVRSTSAQRWTLGLGAVASFVVVLDLFLVATALTAIRRDLGALVGQLEHRRCIGRSRDPFWQPTSAHPLGGCPEQDHHETGERRRRWGI